MLDRRLLIVFFLHVLEVIGFIQEVQVRIGDTIVLNCTCSSHKNGLWLGPKGLPSRKNNINEEELVPYADGFRINSKLNLSNIDIIGSYQNRTCNLVITNFLADDEGKYKCQYVDNYTTHTHIYKVSLKNPPKVFIETTRLRNVFNYKCHVHDASEDPEPSIFTYWNHISESGKYIRSIENTPNGTLVLQKDNYQDSGIYLCKLKNSMPDMNSDRHKKGKVVLHYEGPPVFVLNNSKTWFSHCDEEVYITLKVFSSSDIISSHLDKREEQHDEGQSFEVLSSLVKPICRGHLLFYNVSAVVPCFALTLKLTISRIGLRRNYSAKVCNKYGCNEFAFAVIVAGIPDPPSNISPIGARTRILLKWYPGFNGGCSQNFFIEYRQISMALWKTIGPIPDNNVTDNVFTIPALYPDTKYEIRMYAINKAGDSVKTNISTILTKELREDRQSFVWWIIISVMVILAATCFGVVFVVVRKREKRKKCRNIRQSDLDMNIQGESVDNRLYLSSDFRQSHFTGNQLEIQSTGQPSSALDSFSDYPDEIIEEQNVFHSNQIIPTQHTESNLNYAEVIFEAAPSTSTGVVHGKEDRTMYSEIDLLCHADAIPSSSESDDDFMYVDGIENYKKHAS